MRKFISTLLVSNLLVLFVLLTSVTGQQSPTLQSVFFPASCERTCWLGIQPGITAQEDAIDILTANNLIPVENSLGVPPAPVLDIITVGFVIDQHQFDFIDTSGAGAAIEAVNDTVFRITLPVNFSVEEFIMAFGRPDRVITQGRLAYEVVFENLGVILGLGDSNFMQVKYMHLATPDYIRDFYPISHLTPAVDDCSVIASGDCPVPTAIPNTAPTATANTQGGDTVVHTDTESAMVNLQGAGSDTDGTIISYEWTNNGAVIATEANPQVTLSAGVHTLTLTVTDDDGATASDDVVVTVNRLPVPEITAFQIAWTRNVELIGNASTDPDGSIVSYQWLQNGVEIATVEDPGIIENVPLGSHTYTLIVQDDKGGEVSVDAIVEVVNHNPVAVANYTVDMRQMQCAPGDMFCFPMFVPYLILDASGSSDSDGTITSYEWYLEGNLITGQDTSTPGHEIQAPNGLIASKITLTVIDNDGGQSGDEFHYPVDNCGCPVEYDACLNMGCLD
jgi:hypothetical protein